MSSGRLVKPTVYNTLVFYILVLENIFTILFTHIRVPSPIIFRTCFTTLFTTFATTYFAILFATFGTTFVTTFVTLFVTTFVTSCYMSRRFITIFGTTLVTTFFRHKFSDEQN